MRVEVMPVLPVELLDRARGFYRDAFAEPAVVAVNRHVLHQLEFDELMGDPRADKYVAFDAGGDVIGLASTSPERIAPLDAGRHTRRAVKLNRGGGGPSW
jgi:hypothetical protein